MKETQLHSQLKKRDPKAYEKIIEDYSKLLYKVAHGILDSVQDIEEICSDTFMHLWLYPEKYNPGKGSLKTYLCIVCKNKSIDRLRKIKKVAYLPYEDVTSEDGFEEMLHQKYLVNEVYKHVETFKEPDKEIFLLRFFYQMKPSEIALKLSLPVKTVTNLLYQGKMKMKKLMEGDIYE